MILSGKLSFINKTSGHFNFRLPALLGLLVLFFLPPDGLGMITCWFQLVLDVPCPACGLTRGMTSLLQLEIYKSFIYHPMALIVLGYLFVLAYSNEPDYLRKAVKKKYPKLAAWFTFRVVAFVFIILWIIKLLKIYLPI